MHKNSVDDFMNEIENVFFASAQIHDRQSVNFSRTLLFCCLANDVATSAEKCSIQPNEINKRGLNIKYFR